MSFRSILAKPFASYVVKNRRKWEERAVETQLNLMKSLVSDASQTLFGKDNKFSQISDYQDFKQAVQVQDYENLKPYIEKVIA
ncbi:MAG: hypothetical protein RLZZ306_3015, partial [Bacteroidota bacterium]